MLEQINCQTHFQEPHIEVQLFDIMVTLAHVCEKPYGMQAFPDLLYMDPNRASTSHNVVMDNTYQSLDPTHDHPSKVRHSLFQTSESHQLDANHASKVLHIKHLKHPRE